jgi:23S rRNA (cytosine1962-C5)-methyltransferase
LDSRSAAAGHSADYGEFLSLLSSFLSVPAVEARRVFHGRGQRYPGLEHLNVDWFPPVLLLSAYLPLSEIDDLVGRILATDRHGQIRSLVLQQRERRGSSSRLLWGEDWPSCVVAEDGLRFEVRPGANRNAGLFLDMRPLRQWLRNHSEGRKVLNLFAYTCSLSVAALTGGARQVVNVDMSRPAIQWGMRNHLLNGQPLSRIVPLPHNVFTSWGKIRQLGPYDLILVDPPSSQRGSFKVENNYPTVIRRLPKLLASGGEVIATVNSPFLDRDFLSQQFARYAPQLQLLEPIPVAKEFRDRFPDRGLKIYRLRAATST